MLAIGSVVVLDGVSGYFLPAPKVVAVHKEEERSRENSL